MLSSSFDLPVAGGIRPVKGLHHCIARRGLDSRAARSALKQQGLVTAPTQFNRKLHALLLPKKEVWSCEVTL